MKIILLEKINNLGNIGDEVLVRPGFARNYLFPKYKAVLSNKKNRLFFKDKIKDIEKTNKKENEEVKNKEEKIKQLEVNIKVKCSTKGSLFGSVSNKQISQFFKENNIDLEKNDIEVQNVINKIGKYEIIINVGKNKKIKKNISVLEEL